MRVNHTKKYLTLTFFGLLSACAHKRPNLSMGPAPAKVSDFDEAALKPTELIEALDVSKSDESRDDVLTQLELSTEGSSYGQSFPTSGVVNAKSLRNPAVQNWIRYFSRGDKSRFQRHLDRAEPYRKVVQEIFVKNGIPADIFYLGIVESGFVTGARSVADAVGVWQFIQPTGERYGLDVNSWVDERRDVIRATEAAAKYLRDLHNVFNSWELAMAAYNTGEGRVLRAILRGKTRDFWSLLGRRILPKETEDYVPKFVAAAYVYENAEKFGFSLPEDEDHPRLAVVDLPSRVRLSDIARIAKINPEKLAFYNPHLLRGMTPPGPRSYKIWVPRQYQRNVLTALAALPRGASSLAAAQTLGYSPATRPVAPRKVLNPFAPPTKLAARVPAQATPKVVSTSSSGKSTNRTRTIYVKRGENLESIARKFNVSVENLKVLNRMRSGKILAGQELKVPVQQSFSPVLRTKNVIVKYRVQEGDSLTSIADQFGITVEKLRKDNKLRRQTIFAGEVIRVDRRGI
jgi:membrane-bound lytic murein transglycosylase D